MLDAHMIVNGCSVVGMMFRQCCMARLVFLKNCLGIVGCALSSTESNCILLKFSRQHQVGRASCVNIPSREGQETLTTAAATPSLPPQ